MLSSFLVVFVSCAQAEESKAERDRYISEFLNMAINSQVHFPSVLTLYNSESSLNEKKIKQAYPWLAPFIFRGNNAPKSAVINKWNKPIRVSMGYPNDLESPNTTKLGQDDEALWPIFSSALEINDPAKEKIVVDEIERVAPELSRLINLPVKYVPHEQEKEVEPSNVRIIFSDKIFMKNKYKPDVFIPGIHTYGGVRDSFDAFVNRSLFGVVFFSPDSSQQVYGYVFPDTENSIQMSFCYIWNGHSEEILRSLTKECLLSSMGLTNREKITAFSEAGEFSENDKNFISFLYLPEVKSGYDYIQAYKVVQKEIH